MTAPNKSTPRVAKLRADRKAAGLKELRNLWAYPSDEPAIRDHAEKLTRRTARKRLCKK